MSENRMAGALAGRLAPTGLAIGMREVTDLGMVDLKGKPDDQGFLAAARDALGLDLPLEPRTSVTAGGVTALNLSPDQWLLLFPRSDVEARHSALVSAIARQHALAVDVSDARTVIRLEGSGVREVLMKGTSIDLTDPKYGPGTVRRLRFGEIAALVHIVDGTAIDLYVFRSYAAYAWDWLAATAGEQSAIGLWGPQPAPAV